MENYQGFSKENLDNFLSNAGEDGGVLGGELGEDFTVQFNAGLFQFVDESGVGPLTIFTESRVQAHYPELAEVGLLIAAVCEGVSARAHKRLVRGVKLLRADASVALGALQNILTSLIGVDATLNSSHKL